VVCSTDSTASVSFTIAGRTTLVASADTTTYYSVKLFDINNQKEIVDENIKITNIFHPVITNNRVEKEPVLDENGEPTLDENGEIITNEVTYKDTLWTEGCYEPTKLEEVRMVSHKEYTEDLKGFDCNDKITVSGLGAGAYSIRFYKGTCEFAKEITFTIGITGSTPIAYINEVGSFCDETEVTINPIVESNPAVTKYEWLLGDEVIGETKDLTRAFVLDENNKTLKLSATNKCGTTISNSVLVQVNPRPTALLETSKGYLCKNQTTEVSITLTGEGPFTYTLPDGTEKTVTDVYSKEEVTPARDTIFTFTTLKDANCEAQIVKDVNTVETKIYPEPEYDMTITVPEPMVSGRYVKVNATEGFAGYTLLINEEEIPAKGPENIFWAKKFPYGMSTNDFKMTFTDENGCDWTLEETQVIESIIFPNIFTPNGDGVNDVFLADYDLKVYDRQGTLMYEGTSGWNGTHNGVEANQGVYLYTVFIPTEDGNLEVIKSTLTLER
jgi:gliding motility-associated-like protein